MTLKHLKQSSWTIEQANKQVKQEYDERYWKFLVRLIDIKEVKWNITNNTIDFACSLPLQSAQFNCFMPQPGTEIWRQFNFQDIDYHKYHVHNISYKHPYISKNDLLRLKTKAYLRFYSRPGIIFQNLKNINSLSHLYYLIKRFINSIV